jgi:hypothetical protein
MNALFRGARKKKNSRVERSERRNTGLRRRPSALPAKLPFSGSLGSYSQICVDQDSAIISMYADSNEAVHGELAVVRTVCGPVSRDRLATGEWSRRPARLPGIEDIP